jgi:hypothetical protein
MSRHAINPVIDYVRDWWDDGDPWGTAINALFDLAEVMYSAGIPIPEELEYRHGTYEAESLEEMATENEDGQTPYAVFVFASAYLSGEITENDMRLAALTLNRYLALCRSAGLDY